MTGRVWSGLELGTSGTQVSQSCLHLNLIGTGPVRAIFVFYSIGRHFMRIIESEMIMRGRIRKRSPVCFKGLTQHFLEELEEAAANLRIAGIPVVIRSGCLLDTCLGKTNLLFML